MKQANSFRWRACQVYFLSPSPVYSFHIAVRKEPIRTNDCTESPEDYFRFNFGYDVVRDSEQIMKSEFPGWKLPESFIGKKVGEPEAKKVVALETKKTDARVSVRSVVASFESIKV
jgi:hypothetical protein